MREEICLHGLHPSQTSISWHCDTLGLDSEEPGYAGLSWAQCSFWPKQSSKDVFPFTVLSVDDEMMSTEMTLPSSTELTELGKCLMKQEDVCTALMVTAFASLSWKDTLSCQRTTTQLCWPLLKQVLKGSLIPEAVTWFFVSVLQGLQTHGQHDGCMAALVHLAFQIYEALRPRYTELKAVMEQIPEIQKESLEQFDSKLLNPTLQKVADKRRKDHFKRLIAGCIEVGDHAESRGKKSSSTFRNNSRFFYLFDRQTDIRPRFSSESNFWQVHFLA
uniref:Exportin-5 C-terminal domain-containing protein n=1 Tax=Sphenodon punctatus TaxID=8508 RepID=A0A8D0H7M4_SPHPU